MNPAMFLEVFRIHECGIANVAFERSLAGVGGFQMVVQKAATFERLSTFFAFVSFVVVVSCPLVRLKVAALTETCPAKIALERPLS